MYQKRRKIERGVYRMPTQRDYELEIQRDQDAAQAYRKRADAARKEGKRRDAEQFEQAARSWDRHADKHVRILASMIGQEQTR
jgi:hypothetical protein